MAPILAATPRSTPPNPEQRLGLRPALVDRWPDYHVNTSRPAHHASAASIALSASDTPTVPCTPVGSLVHSLPVGGRRSATDAPEVLPGHRPARLTLRRPG